MSGYPNRRCIEGYCPRCGEELDYGDYQTDDDDSACVKCTHCKWSGKEQYEKKFDGFYDDTKKDWIAPTE